MFKRSDSHGQICEQILALINPNREFFHIQPLANGASIHVKQLPRLKDLALVPTDRVASENHIERYVASLTVKEVQAIHMTLPLTRCRDVAGILFEDISDDLFSPEWFKGGVGVTGLSVSRVTLRLKWGTEPSTLERFFREAAEALLRHDGLL